MVDHENRQSTGDNKQEIDSFKQADLLFAKDCAFITGAAREDQLPSTSLPEFAFAGRSNVGKSSLINALVNRKNLVKTSKTPGRTQQINFFNLASSLLLVDLPGYGYAKASKKSIHEWNQLIEDYLKGRAQLKRVYILVDSRHGLKPVDLKTMEMLDEAAVSYQIVLTKADKITKNQQTSCIKEITNRIAKRAAAFPDVLITSADKKDGLSELRNSILKLL